MRRDPLLGGLREPLALSAILFLYSNGLTLLAKRRGKDPERTYLFTNPALLLALLSYASRRQGGLQATGLSREKLGGSLLLGLATGGLLSIVPLAFFRKPVLLDTPLEYGPVTTMAARDLLQDIGLRVPINIAFLEELAFRGLLYDMLRVRYSDRAAIAGSTTAFVCWHFSVTYLTISGQTNVAGSARLPGFLQPFVPALALSGGLASIGIAGLAFALIRRYSGNLAGSIAAHWLVDSAMIAALWLSARKQRKSEAVT